ncbi:hypothetical protein K3X13_13285 [Aliiroseovarius crassostreae]|uniref:hypothetical protein n=1 Tax=Aliiroseovarius TaxID=1658781 RepID=UPI001568C514|nr:MULTISPECIES: hypothetical protein [Aliiroseovarius]UWP91982.1 hypothetical protein K3X13_13285 [Aliiroseovarius crassostreae]
MSVFFLFPAVIASAVTRDGWFGRSVGASLPQFPHATPEMSETIGNKPVETPFGPDWPAGFQNGIT